MYTLAIKWSDAKKNPAAQVSLLEEPPGRTRFLTIEECRLLIQSCAEHLKPIVITALNTGMRLNELLNLTWDRIHIENVIDPYIELVVTKNNKNRFIPLNKDLINLLIILKSKNKDSEYVFLSIHGKPLHSIRKPFQKTLQLAGILNFRFHDLRHTFASHFVMNDGDLLVLKDILGHSSMKMVERYTHLAAAYKRRQINNLNGMFLDVEHLHTSKPVKKVQ